MIDKETYLNAKNIVKQYEADKLRLSRFGTHSKCPFCGGTKTKPFVRTFVNQNCTDCNDKGMISNSQLMTMGLEEYISR